MYYQRMSSDVTDWIRLHVCDATGGGHWFECWVCRVNVSSSTVLLITCILLKHCQAKFGCCISGLNIRLRCIILVGFDHPALMLFCSELLQLYQTNLFLIIPLHL
jgi:hypothetical protein